MIKTFFAIFIMLISFCLWASGMEFTQPVKVDQRIEGNNIKPLMFDDPWDIVWTRTYGENYDDKAYAVAVDSQGYYVVAGVSDDQQCSSPPCWWCIWLLKIDPVTGDTIWARKYFEYTGIEEAVNAMVVDRDGYYVIAGYNVSDWGARRTDIYILKIDPLTGNTIWTKSYGGSERETAYDVAVDDSGYYVVAGWTESFGVSWRDYLVLKIDPITGDTIWSKIYGGSQSDEAHAVTVSRDGYYIVTGTSHSLGGNWILKIDPSTGDTVLTKILPPCGPYNLPPSAFDITTGPDGYYYLTGEIAEDPTPMAKSEIWVGKLSPELDIIWNRIYGGSSYDYSYGITMNKFGDCVVAGQTFTGYYYVGWVLKIKSTTGDTIWTKKYGEIAKLRDIVVDRLGYYFAAGYTQDPYYYYDYWIFKLVGDMDTLCPEVQVSFPNGGENFIVGDTCDIIWIATDNVGVDSISIFYSINAGMSWDTIATGEPNDSLYEWIIPDTQSDSCLVKVVAYDSSLNAGEDESDSLFTIHQFGIEESISSPISSTLFQIRPNPFKEKTEITFSIGQSALGGVDSRQKSVVSLKIYDVSGRLVKDFSRFTLDAQRPTLLSWDGRDDAGNEVQCGVYFCRFVAGNYQSTKKLLRLQ